MNPRKLSPAVLAALGLSACVDGCDPADLPIVGSLFGDGGDSEDDSHVGPCLKVMPCLSPPVDVMPCLSPPVRDTAVQPCLKVVPPATPITKPIRVGPCLRMVAPQRPTPVPQPSVKPCLDFVAPEPVAPSPPPPPADAPQDGAIVPERVEVLAALVDAGVLAPDVANQARRRK